MSVSPAKARLLEKHEDDIVIVSAVRSAITGKWRIQRHKDTKPDPTLSSVLRAAYERAKLDPQLIDDIAIGNVLPPGGGASAAHMAALHAGIPEETSINIVNRQCSSGLTAINQIANEIRVGQIQIDIGPSVESMTFGYGSAAAPDVSDEVLSNLAAANCFLPMGVAGKFREDIIVGEEEREVVVHADDGILEGVTAESLAKLKPAFSKTGTTHAGNASQVSDGAAAVILTTRALAKKISLPILGKFVTSSVAGVSPRVMGAGAAFAIPKVLDLVGLMASDVGFYEINEAFASQAVYSIQKLGIKEEKVNLNGGAIAIGHPLGCTYGQVTVTVCP
ncbi:thiolase-like protein [Cyathus striatus]|nr:thiolase-like protein [Cyathus striatus]